MNEPIILLVEDNPDDVKLTLKALQKNNILNRIEVTSDGQEALEWLFCTGKYADRDPHAMPILTLLDLNLPKIGGLEVLKRIRENERTALLPVVILTSSVQEQDLLRSYSLHVNSYIQKPVDFIQFAESVRQIGAYWLVLNEPPQWRT